MDGTDCKTISRPSNLVLLNSNHRAGLLCFRFILSASSLPHAAQRHLAFANGVVVVGLGHVLGGRRDGRMLPRLLRRRVFPLLGGVLQQLKSTMGGADTNVKHHGRKSEKNVTRSQRKEIKSAHFTPSPPQKKKPWYECPKSPPSVSISLTFRHGIVSLIRPTRVLGSAASNGVGSRTMHWLSWLSTVGASQKRCESNRAVPLVVLTYLV